MTFIRCSCSYIPVWYLPLLRYRGTLVSCSACEWLKFLEPFQQTCWLHLLQLTLQGLTWLVWQPGTAFSQNIPPICQHLSLSGGRQTTHFDTRPLWQTWKQLFLLWEGFKVFCNLFKKPSQTKRFTCRNQLFIMQHQIIDKTNFFSLQNQFYASEIGSWDSALYDIYGFDKYLRGKKNSQQDTTHVCCCNSFATVEAFCHRSLTSLGTRKNKGRSERWVSAGGINPWITSWIVLDITVAGWGTQPSHWATDPHAGGPCAGWDTCWGSHAGTQGDASALLCSGMCFRKQHSTVPSHIHLYHTRHKLRVTDSNAWPTEQQETAAAGKASYRQLWALTAWRLL